MPAISDYNVCVAARDDAFVPGLDAITGVIDFLDSKLFLDGPDRDDSRLVLLPTRETKDWQNYIRTNPEQPVAKLRKRYVNLLHSPTAQENYYKHYGELATMVDNVMPRDSAFVAALGRGTRRLYEMAYCPQQPDEARRWVQYMVVHILRGYHALWDRVWDDEVQHRMWELKAVKGFTLIIHCKLDPKAQVMPLPDYLTNLRTKPAFNDFLNQVGRLVGTNDFELIGEHTS